MTRIRQAPATATVHSNRVKLRKPTSKELDLLLLAGCSCLMTVLYHPVADALRTPQSGASVNGAIATHAQKTTTNSMNAFHLVLPPTREESEEEDA
jgi:hypothetical protein